MLYRAYVQYARHCVCNVNRKSSGTPPSPVNTFKRAHSIRSTTDTSHQCDYHLAWVEIQQVDDFNSTRENDSSRRRSRRSEGRRKEVWERLSGWMTNTNFLKKVHWLVSLSKRGFKAGPLSAAWLWPSTCILICRYLGKYLNHILFSHLDLCQCFKFQLWNLRVFHHEKRASSWPKMIYFPLFHFLPDPGVSVTFRENCGPLVFNGLIQKILVNPDFFEISLASFRYENCVLNLNRSSTILLKHQHHGSITLMFGKRFSAIST